MHTLHSYSSVSISTRNLKRNYKDMIGVKLKNGSRACDHAILGVVCHRRLGFDIIYLHTTSFYMQNLTIQASAVTEIWLVPTKI